MKVFTCNDHAGYYPVGVASVVVAADEDQARKILEIELASRGLSHEGFTLNELSLEKLGVVVLCDGNY